VGDNGSVIEAPACIAMWSIASRSKVAGLFIQNNNVVEDYLRIFGNRIETRTETK
jgi:hypothetical protein